MVMKIMRKNLKTILWFTAITFIGATFMGLGSYYFSKRKTDVVARINKKKITTEMFYKVFYENLRTYRYVYNMDITDEMIPQIKKSVLEGMIHIELLVAEMKKEHIKVSNQAVIDKIRRNPSFQKNGKFNKQIYIERLGYQRKTPQTYEDEIRNSLKSEKIGRLITSGVKVTTPELKEEYKRRKYNPEVERDTFEKRKGMMADSLIMQKKNLYYREWLNNLKSKATIENNLAKIDRTIK